MSRVVVKRRNIPGGKSRRNRTGQFGNGDTVSGLITDADMAQQVQGSTGFLNAEGRDRIAMKVVNIIVPRDGISLSTGTPSRKNSAATQTD